MSIEVNTFPTPSLVVKVKEKAELFPLHWLIIRFSLAVGAA